MLLVKKTLIICNKLVCLLISKDTGSSFIKLVVMKQ